MIPGVTVTPPAGLIPVRSLTTGEILRGNRVTAIRVDLLSRDEVPKGRLDGVLGGSIDWTAHASVHGGGSLSIRDVGQSVDWLNDRVRPVITIDGLPEQPLGVFLFAETPEQWDDTGRVWEIGLLDKTSILDQDAVDETYALDAGTVVTDAVVALIASTGESSIAVTPSSATLSGPLAWEAGTSKLKIVNDLLATINYFSLYCDELGQFRAEPYTRPAARPIAWEFLDGDDSIYDPEFRRDIDLYAIPNRVTVITRGSGDTAPLTSTVTNEDPASRFSTVSRGRVIAHVERDVEIVDQAALDAYARRRLIELTTPTSSVEIRHAYVPGLRFNDAVRFRRVPTGIDARHVVSKTSVSLDPAALAVSIFQEVVDL